MLGLLQYRTWALAESYFNRMYPVVADAMMKGHNLIKKKTISDFHSRIEALIDVVDPDTDRIRIATDPWTGKEVVPTVKVGSKVIALIPVIGPVTKYGDACSYGMQDYQRFMSIALKDDQVHGIVLIMDTPGGTVDGTPEFGMAVKNATKPIGVFGDGMVASAGLWIASQADLIVGNKNNPTEFGSIGVLMVNEDWSNVIESGRAPKMTIIRAPGSEQKALLNPLEPLTDELLALVKADLKSIRDEFVSTIKSGRGEKLDAKYPGLFSGQMFDVHKSKAAGLIDSIGTLSTAINKIAEMSRKKEKGTTGASAPTANTQMKYPKLSAIFSGQAWNKVLSAFTEDQAELEATEKKVVDMEAELTQLKADKKTSDEKITALNAKVTELNTQVTTLTTANTTLTTEKADLQAKLDKAPAGAKTTAVSQGDPEGGKDKKLKSWELKAQAKVGSPA